MQYNCLALLAVSLFLSSMAMDNAAQDAEEAFRKSDYKQAEKLYKNYFAHKYTTTEAPQARIHINYAETLLARGKFENGFKAFDARFLNKDMNRKPLQKSWDGNADVRGKTILARGEHGIGDTFLFMRYLQQLYDAGAQVVVRE